MPGFWSTVTALALGTSFVLPDDVAPPALHKEAVVKAPRAKVWEAWTTGDGLRSFFAPHANVELRLGGPYELFFTLEAPEGTRGSEGCRVLSFLPERMLSFTWSAPPQFPEERAQRSFVVIELEDVDGGATRVRLTHDGFGRGGKWPEVRAYFDSAWSSVLAHLGKRFTDGPLAPASPAMPAPAPRTYFVSFLRPKDMQAMANLSPEGREAFTGHIAYLKSLQSQGRLVLAGPSLLTGAGDGSPFGGPAIGLCIFHAKDEAEARALAAGDPMVKIGLFEMTLRPFTLSFERP